MLGSPEAGFHCFGFDPSIASWWLPFVTASAYPAATAPSRLCFTRFRVSSRTVSSTAAFSSRLSCSPWPFRAAACRPACAFRAAPSVPITPNVKFSGPPGLHHQMINCKKREGGSAATRVRQAP